MYLSLRFYFVEKIHLFGLLNELRENYIRLGQGKIDHYSKI